MSLFCHLGFPRYHKGRMIVTILNAFLGFLSLSMVAKRPALFRVTGSFLRGGPQGTLHVFTDAPLYYVLSPGRVLASLPIHPGNSAWSFKRTQYLCPQNGQCFHLIAGIYPKNINLPTMADMHEWTPSFLGLVSQGCCRLLVVPPPWCPTVSLP